MNKRRAISSFMTPLALYCSCKMGEALTDLLWKLAEEYYEKRCYQLREKKKEKKKKSQILVADFN